MCDRTAVIYFASLDVLLIGELLIGELGIGNRESGIGESGIGNWESGIVGNCVKSGYTIIEKPKNYLAAAGIALLHCILFA